MNRLKQSIGKRAYWFLSPLVGVALNFGAVRTRVFIIVGDEILVVKNWFGPGTWSLPGGGVHRNEDPKTGAVREVLEEVGVRLHEEQLRTLTEQPMRLIHGSARINVMVYAVVLPEKPVLTLQKNEISGSAWMLPEKIKIKETGKLLGQLLPILEAHQNLLK